MFGRWFWIFNVCWLGSMFVFGRLLARYEHANYELTVLLLIAVTGSTIVSRLEALKAAVDASNTDSD